MRARGAVRRLPDGGYSLGGARIGTVVSSETCVALGRLRAPYSTSLTAGRPSRSMATLDGSAASVTRSCWNASTSSASTILRPLSSRRISPFAFFGYGAATRAPKNVLELGECPGSLTGCGHLDRPPAGQCHRRYRVDRPALVERPDPADLVGVAALHRAVRQVRGEHRVATVPQCPLRDQPVKGLEGVARVPGGWLDREDQPTSETGLEQLGGPLPISGVLGGPCLTGKRARLEGAAHRGRSSSAALAAIKTLRSTVWRS
jgi:hypothetical protein